MSKHVKVFLADDHTILLDAFVRLLDGVCDVVGTAGNGRELLNEAPAKAPDIVITDIAMPGLNGVDAAKQLKILLPEVKIIFLTQNDDPDVAAAVLADGAAGYLLKDCAGKELIEAINAVQGGQTYLTPLLAGTVLDASRRISEDKPVLTIRQREVLQLVAEGYTMAEVGKELSITPRTVAHHKYKIMELVEAETTADLVRYAIREGIVAK